MNRAVELLKRLSKFVTRSKDELSLEYKFLKLTTFTALLLSLMSLVVNYNTQSHYDVNFWGSVAAFLFLLTYLISLKRVNYYLLFYMLLFDSVVSVVLTWKYFDGYHGSAFYVMLIFVCFFSMLSKGAHSAAILIIFTLLLISLCAVELYFPQFILPYKDKTSSFIDIIVSVLTAILTIFIIVKLIFHKYIERESVHFQNNVLNGKNEIISEQNIKLSELNITKDKLFSILAHDLKGPIGNFKSISAMLYDSFYDFNDEEKLEILSVIKDSATNIQELLENLLLWSVTQSGKITYNPEEFDISELLANCIKLYKIPLKNKNIEIKNKIKTGTMVFADRNMIKTVVRNLISNAIKYSLPDGLIEIFSEEEAGTLLVSVRDYGIGMNSETLASLFSIEKQVSNPGTSREIGTGLGLVISKDMIRQNNGDLTVVSESNSGSTFTFSVKRNVNS